MKFDVVFVLLLTLGMLFSNLVLAVPDTQRKVALVIGNSDYQEQSKLANAANDAEDVCQVLSKLKFDVTCKRNLQTKREMRSALLSFKEKLDRGSVAVFYYAGHGTQVNGENYLLPTKAVIRDQLEIEDESLSLGLVMQAINEAQSDLSIIVLDACRNNPFGRGFTRSNVRGLAAVSATPHGSIVVYSTAANDVALDGKVSERNSPFTQHLLKNIDKPGVTVEGLFKKVALGVQEDSMRAIGKRQTPFIYQSYTGEFCFAGCTEVIDTTKLKLEAEQLAAQRKEIEAREAKLLELAKQSKKNDAAQYEAGVLAKQRDELARREEQLRLEAKNQQRNQAELERVKAELDEKKKQIERANSEMRQQSPPAIKQENNRQQVDVPVVF